MAKILVVDDNSQLNSMLKDVLESWDYTVLLSEDGFSCLDLARKEKPDIILLDIMLAEQDGFQVCREIRKKSQCPIIMLTARSDEKDELRGFELGVDEYVTKPFSPRTLAARVNAILRRTLGTAAEKQLEAGGIELDKAAHIVKIDGEPIDLSYKEFELLQYFMENNGIALSRERILNSVWNYDYYGDARTIDTHVKKLRSKLGSKSALIKTVWGIGYKFEA